MKKDIRNLYGGRILTPAEFLVVIFNLTAETVIHKPLPVYLGQYVGVAETFLLGRQG